MARPATNYAAKKAEIVAAAIKSFARYGYEGTTNKTIATEGGFKSPALIYHYFPGGKTELFMACLEEFQPLKTVQEVATSNMDAPPEVYLPDLARAYLKLVKDETTGRIFQIMLAEMVRFPELAEVIPRRIFPAIVLPLFNYLNKQVKAGNIELDNAMSVALTFFGPYFLRGLIYQVQAVTDIPVPVAVPTEQQLIETACNIFLHGIWREPVSNKLPQEQENEREQR
ncbi:MAG TPA: TetR/AcrR family transcriptional regulator [Chloroflexia bacterium]|nr:TetR/AcrR family transcriptional regulator [Chloroflexia bacterium]